MSRVYCFFSFVSSLSAVGAVAVAVAVQWRARAVGRCAYDTVRIHATTTTETTQNTQEQQAEDTNQKEGGK